MKTFIWIAVVTGAVIICAAGVWIFFGPGERAEEKAAVAPPTTYKCSEGQSIHAVFEKERAMLTLSDGRALTLSSVPAASGARYANTSGSIIFWTKGYGAFLEEGGETTFLGCRVDPLPFSAAVGS